MGIKLTNYSAKQIHAADSNRENLREQATMIIIYYIDAQN